MRTTKEVVERYLDEETDGEFLRYYRLNPLCLELLCADAEDAVIDTVLWLIDCEADGAQTNGHDEAVRTCENIARRIRGHYGSREIDEASPSPAP